MSYSQQDFEAFSSQFLLRKYEYILKFNTISVVYPSKKFIYGRHYFVSRKSFFITKTQSYNYTAVFAVSSSIDVCPYRNAKKRALWCYEHDDNRIALVWGKLIAYCWHGVDANEHMQFQCANYSPEVSLLMTTHENLIPKEPILHILLEKKRKWNLTVCV